MAAAFMFLRMADPRDEQRAWLRGVLAQTGLAPTALAQKAKVAQPTITTFLNKPDVSHALSARTISKIEAATGLRYGPDPRPAGFRESEATPFESPKGNDELAFLDGVGSGANGIDKWMLRSRALETAGYQPGDVLIVDLNREPRPGDVVCAQLYDWARAKAETVFRLWEPPYLAPATHDAALRKIFVVDNENVIIKGVVIASVRGRLARVA